MARMIPESPSEETKSYAEKRLFPKLRDMPDTEDWTVLHSLNIAPHTTQSQGEADFVVIIPSHGVFVLEVKGGRISQRNGQWTTTNRRTGESVIKNPIEEANNAMHSIKDYVFNADVPREIKRVVFGFGVVFPDTTVHGEMDTIEIDRDQIADIDDCRTSEQFREYLLKLAGYWRKRLNNATIPNAEQCGRLIQLLRPNTVGRKALRSQIRDIENQIVEMTANQQYAFNTIIDNDRCIVTGGAGTGKTVIALNYAQLRADEKLRTGFFCYNRKLADHLKNNTPQAENIVCDSFTEYMEKTVAAAGHGQESDCPPSERDAYYKTRLPELFVEACLELDLPQFDILIVDEAQDLITEPYLDAMDLMLMGGLRDGKWCFFMDAGKQNLYNTGTKEQEFRDRIAKFTPYFTRSSLSDNCRNSVAIIEKIDSVFGTKTGHRPYNERGQEVEIRTYKTMSDEAEIIETILRVLEREKVEKKDIIILSPVRFQNSAASILSDSLVSADGAGNTDAVAFSTIQSFKGMESSVVILTDINRLDDEESMNLLYVGMSRAKSALYILARKEAVKRLR